MSNAAEVYLSRWPKGSDTYKTMRGSLDRIAKLFSHNNSDTFDWGCLRYEDTRAIAAKFTDEGLKPRTINKMLSALRGALESAWRLGQIPDEEYRRIKIDNVAGKTLPSGRRLEDAEVEQVFEALGKQRLMDAAVIAVMCSCGLRRIEVVRLKREDYDAAAGELTAYGKGNKERSIPIPPRWQPFIAEWAKTLSPRSFMFFGDDHKPLTRAAVSYVIERFVKSTGMQHFSPHDLRRTYVTQICESTDVSIAQKLAGHSSISSTVIYDRRGATVMKKAVEDL